jgi:N-acetylmuramoyl-L-alanine amidase
MPPQTLRRLSSIDTIVVHCAATPNGDGAFQPINIDDWHKQRKFKRDESMAKLYSPQLKHIGYHRVICVGGEIVSGRTLQEVGAHVEGHNGHTVGVCLIGTDAFDEFQWRALRELVQLLRARIAIAEVVGHRSFNHERPPALRKSCPGFDVGAWLNGGMAPLVGHIFPTEQIKWNH